MADLTGSNRNDIFFFQGSSEQLNLSFTNPYSGLTYTISGEYNSNDVSIEGLAGIDTLFMTNFGDAIFIRDPDTGEQMVSNVEVFFAGSGDDVIILADAEYTLGNTTIDVGTGDDIVLANAGNDTIRGREGNDILDGGPGDDFIHGGNGNGLDSHDDWISGGAGADYLNGEDGNDELQYFVDGFWEAGATTENAVTGEVVSLAGYNRTHDVFNGGTGHDELVLTEGNDALLLDDPDSPFRSSATSLRVIGVEAIDAGGGDDVINLTHFAYGDVSILGGAGDDVIWSGSGNDMLQGGSGNDEMHGGAGNDTAVYTGNRADYTIVAVGGGTYTVSDNRSGSPDGTDTLAGIELLVFADMPGGIALNTPPVAVADSYSVDEDTALNAAATGVLANDSDVDGDSLSAVLVSDVAHGTLALNADGSFSYMPDADYNGADSFTYTANDGTTDGNTVTVDITVNAVNDAPVVAQGIPEHRVGPGESVNLTVPADAFSDVDGDLLTLTPTLENGDPLPNWLTFDSASATFSGLPPAESEDLIQIKVTATDPSDASVSTSFALVIGKTVTGGNGSDLLGGGRGDDHVLGLNGNDELHGGDGHDTMWGGRGADQIFGEAGNDVLHGEAGNDVLEGGEGEDLLDGGDGNDTLVGGLGADSLLGGSGGDQFVYQSPSEGGDLISGFNGAEGDRLAILVDGFDGLVVGKNKNKLDVDSFVAGEDPEASGTHGQFLYETDTGGLWWDADGTGASDPTHLATFDGAPLLTASDFSLV